MVSKSYWKKEWKRATNVLSNAVSCRKYDGAMYVAVEEFKQEMLHWFQQGKAVTENPMKRATQEQWYCLYLEKKRLEQHRLSVQYTAYNNVSYDGISGAQTTYVYHNDGKYLVCNANQMTQIEKNYFRDGALLGQERKSRDISYYIVNSQNENGLYICPNCGAEQSLESLLDGCDYCKTKFDISAYHAKVASFTQNKSMYESRYMTSEGMTWAIVAGIGGVLTICALMLSIVLWAVLLLVPLGILFTIFAYRKMMEKNKDVMKNTDLTYQLQDVNTNFSQEDFIASVDCKLKSIHYAENAQELAAFVKCDVAPYVQSYQSIVSCDLGRIAMKRYYVEGDYQYIDVHREIEVLMDCGNHLQFGRGVVAMTLAKRRANKLKNDIVAFCCNTCGASISLVEGGKCKYCGNEMDYAAYDWIVTGYKHVEEL